MNLGKELVHLCRLVLSDKHADAARLARRALRRIAADEPELAPAASQVLERAASSRVTRKVPEVAAPLPVDMESRLSLLRREAHPALNVAPVWTAETRDELHATVLERQKVDELADSGLTPTRSLLLVGPPGVGKTLAARWLAHQLNRPLLTLDLAAVMSSFLGRTGNNIRVVTDYARQHPSVLLLDEFDAIAKRRDDSSDIGELKRLVNVLLQEVDTWPTDGLLIAATNHPELLDPAVWRRFERVVRFPLPALQDLQASIRNLLDGQLEENEMDKADLLAVALEGRSYADAEREITAIRRAAVISGTPVSAALEQALRRLCSDQPDRGRRKQIAEGLLNLGYSQRHVHRLTGVSRDTTRKILKSR